MQVVRAIGRPEVATDVVEALLVERGYERSFPQAVQGQADVAASADSQGSRRDLTGVATFTIDPGSARDFDDAISIERDGDSLRLYVHIADVSMHVGPGAALDLEAQHRGNSVYVPGTVEPMLPEALSNDACSLVPGRRRDVVTAEIAIDANGAPAGVSFYRSAIHSDAQLTYGQVDEVFAGHSAAPESITKPLSLARDLAATLRDRRFARGALALETSEPEIEFDRQGHVVEARDAVPSESHTLIEEFMILANEQVASQLERRGAPTIYRVHEQPDPEAIERLAGQLESLGVPTPPIPKNLSRTRATELAGTISAKVADYLRGRGRSSEALSSLVLRSLQRAVYSTVNVGHSGLASPCYTHFTSPIRRYPDLVVHRSLLAAFEGGDFPASKSELEEVAQHCSETERAAARIEHAADDICLCFLLERKLYHDGWESRFEGEVSGLAQGAAFVSFGPLPGGANCQGFLPARKLRDDWYDLNELNTALIGRDSGNMVRIGDPVTVKVSRVETARGRIDLEPARN